MASLSFPGVRRADNPVSTGAPLFALLLAGSVAWLLVATPTEAFGQEASASTEPGPPPLGLSLRKPTLDLDSQPTRRTFRAGESGEEENRLPLAVRLLAETGMSVVSGAIALVPAVLLSAPAGLLAGYVFGALGGLVYPLGVGVGVYGGGHLSGADGTAAAAIGGAYVGALLSAFVLGTIVQPTEPLPLLLGFTIPTTVGAIGAYELSAATRSRRASRDAGPAWSPTVRIGRKGAVLGVDIRF